MTSTAKVVLGVGCGLLLATLAGLATCAGCIAMISQSPGNSRPSSPSTFPTVPAEDASFWRIRGQGMIDFVVISKDLSRNKVTLERRVKNFCDLRRGPSSFCWVLIWLKPSMVPRDIPMSDKQQHAQFAVYTRNPTSGYDCLQLLRKGDEYWHSGRCSP